MSSPQASRNDKFSSISCFKSKISGNTSNLSTDRDMYSLTFSSKLGASTTGSFGVRRTEVKGYVDYVENAILGSLLMVF